MVLDLLGHPLSMAKQIGYPVWHQVFSVITPSQQLALLVTDLNSAVPYIPLSGVFVNMMRNYICKWPNGDLVFISARDKQQVREILDEVADPGQCDIKPFKGPVAIEFFPKVPKRPPPPEDEEEDWHRHGMTDEYVAPENPLTRPSVFRWAGVRGTTFYADIWQEAGGQLSPAEAAALQRWKTARQQQAAAAGSAAEEEPWVTDQQLAETGMLDDPYHVQIKLGPTDTYGSFSSNLLKTITKEFFPKTHQALKAVRAAEGRNTADAKRAEAVKGLRAALSNDIRDKQKDEQMERDKARRMVAASSGDPNALLSVMMDQSANVYGRELDDENDEDDDHDEDDDSDDIDLGCDLMRAMRHGRAMQLAADLGINPSAAAKPAKKPAGQQKPAAKQQKPAAKEQKPSSQAQKRRRRT